MLAAASHQRRYFSFLRSLVGRLLAERLVGIQKSERVIAKRYTVTRNIAVTTAYRCSTRDEIMFR